MSKIRVVDEAPEFYITARMRVNNKRLKVTCLSCKESDVVTVDDLNHQVWDFEKKLDTNILAMRWRKDLQWGVECRCGNDNRVAVVERSDFNNIVQGDGASVARIAASLDLPDVKQFKVEVV